MDKEIAALAAALQAYSQHPDNAGVNRLIVALTETLRKHTTDPVSELLIDETPQWQKRGRVKDAFTDFVEVLQRPPVYRPNVPPLQPGQVYDNNGEVVLLDFVQRTRG